MKKRSDKDADKTDTESLFRSAVADATPLAPSNKAKLDKPLPKPRTRRGTSHEIDSVEDRLSDHIPEMLNRQPGQPLRFARPGVQRQTLKRLRRGGAIVQDELDLHGSTTAEARALLVRFLDDACRRGLRYVRVIHGKGLRSDGGEGVLKTRVAGWLSHHEDVLAISEAGPADGGSGAVLVLLRTAL